MPTLCVITAAFKSQLSPELIAKVGLGIKLQSLTIVGGIFGKQHPTTLTLMYDTLPNKVPFAVGVTGTYLSQIVAFSTSRVPTFSTVSVK